MTLKNVGAAEIIEEKDLSCDKLIETVKAIIESPDVLRKMGENAKKSAISDSNERIYSVIMNLYQ